MCHILEALPDELVREHLQDLRLQVQRDIGEAHQRLLEELRRTLEAQELHMRQIHCSDFLERRPAAPPQPPRTAGDMLQHASFAPFSSAAQQSQRELAYQGTADLASVTRAEAASPVTTVLTATPLSCGPLSLTPTQLSDPMEMPSMPPPRVCTPRVLKAPLSARSTSKTRKSNMSSMAAVAGRTIAGLGSHLKDKISTISSGDSSRPVTRRLQVTVDSVVPIHVFPSDLPKGQGGEPPGLLRSPRMRVPWSGIRFEEEEHTDELLPMTKATPKATTAGTVREGWATPLDLEEDEGLPAWTSKGSHVSVVGDLPRRRGSIVGRLQEEEEASNGASSSWREDLVGKPKSCMQRMVGSSTFDTCFTLLIVLNALTIGLQTDHMARESTEVVPRTYVVTDKIFCAFFFFELLLRVMTFRCFFFAETGLFWGLFDTCLVGLQVVEELLKIVASTSSELDGESGTGAGNMSFMRIVRILRLIRILRIIRIIRFMDELRTLVSSIMNSMRSLFWTLALLLLGIYVVGIYFTQLVLDWRLARSGSMAEHSTLSLQFGGLPASMLSLYQAMSGGIDWNDLCHPLVTEISPLQGLVFVLYIAFTVLALTNVVTGVFVQGALESAKQEEEDVMLETLRQMFWKQKDGPHTGYLSREQFRERLGKPKMRQYLHSINVDPIEANMLFTLIDDDGSGLIDAEEFVGGCMRIRGASKAIDTMLLLHEVVGARRDLDLHRRWSEEQLVQIATAVRVGALPSATPGLRCGL